MNKFLESFETRRPRTGAKNGPHSLPFPKSKQPLHKPYDKVEFRDWNVWGTGVPTFVPESKINKMPKSHGGGGGGVDLIPNFYDIHSRSGQKYMVLTAELAGTKITEQNVRF